MPLIASPSTGPAHAGGGRRGLPCCRAGCAPLLRCGPGQALERVRWMVYFDSSLPALLHVLAKNGRGKGLPFWNQKDSNTSSFLRERAEDIYRIVSQAVKVPLDQVSGGRGLGYHGREAPMPAWQGDENISKPWLLSIHTRSTSASCYLSP